MMKTKNLLLIITIFTFIFSGCDNKTDESQEVENPLANIIIDDAYVLQDDKNLLKTYAEYNEWLLKEFDIDFRVVTTLTEEDIDTFTNKEFSRLQKDTRSQSGKALLLVINTIQDKVRLEVSMALEPIYTDAFISYIERKGFIPYFRDNKVADGMYMATELVKDRAYEAAQDKEFMPPMQSKSIGAGAKAKALIGQKDPNAKKGKNIESFTHNTPKQVLEKYIDGLKKHNKNPNLDIYTEATKEFFRNWTLTDINQNNEVRFLSPCMGNKKTFYSSDDNYAVMLNDPVNDRTCSPYFFKKESGKWKLDFATMSRTLRFNVEMLWHFDKKERLKGEGMYYAFAFDGLQFNKDGYPFYPKYPKSDELKWGFQCSIWYYPNERDKAESNPQKYVRCKISRVWAGSPAEVRLGLSVHDYIHAVGEGSNRKENVTQAEFMNYMNSVPSGQKVTVDIRRNNKELIVREGIAP